MGNILEDSFSIVVGSGADFIITSTYQEFSTTTYQVGAVPEGNILDASSVRGYLAMLRPSSALRQLQSRSNHGQLRVGKVMSLRPCNALVSMWGHDSNSGKEWAAGSQQGRPLATLFLAAHSMTYFESCLASPRHCNGAKK